MIWSNHESTQHASRRSGLTALNLSSVEGESVDFVTTYSVLHHIPDYLGILAEFMRVLKPGGVVFIDHELSAEVWKPTRERTAFLEEMAAVVGQKWKKYFRIQNYINWFVWKFINPRYRSEGDIHGFTSSAWRV